jgi:hypothetical protein
MCVLVLQTIVTLLCLAVARRFLLSPNICLSHHLQLSQQYSGPIIVVWLLSSRIRNRHYSFKQRCNAYKPCTGSLSLNLPVTLHPLCLIHIRLFLPCLSRSAVYIILFIRSTPGSYHWGLCYHWSPNQGTKFHVINPSQIPGQLLMDVGNASGFLLDLSKLPTSRPSIRAPSTTALSRYL